MLSLLSKLYRFVFKYRSYIRFKRLVSKINITKTVQIQRDIRVDSPENLTIEDYVYIGSNAKIHASGTVKISRGVVIGPELRIYSVNHRFRNAESIPYDNVNIKKPVIIEENVWIGGGVTITPGTIIGEGSIVGAGAVVSGTIEKMSIIVGNPAKSISKRNEADYYNLKKEDKIYLKLKQEKYFIK